MPDGNDGIQKPETGKRLAVVAGVNRTKSTVLGSLENAIADAEAIHNVLYQRCGFTDPTLLVGSNATSAAIKRAVLDLARASNEDDFLLFYFSGHGQQCYDEYQPTRRHTYIGTYDFNEQDVEDDPSLHISMHWLREQLFKKPKAGQVLIILDCCYSEDIRTESNHNLDELRQQLTHYFQIPGAEEEKRQSGLRTALAAARYDQAAQEQGEHGVMTRLLLNALSGKIPSLLEDGQLTLTNTIKYIISKMSQMSEKQTPVYQTSNSTGKECVLAHFPVPPKESARSSGQPPQPSGREPLSFYVPLDRNPLFQPRLGEFKELEDRLLEQGRVSKPQPIGIIGMPGIGKTQLAVELAYRLRDQKRFLDGIFWMSASGGTFLELLPRFAELAKNIGYLPPDDDVSHPENEERRAIHLCRYLAQCTDALLILDNVEDMELVRKNLRTLVGEDTFCPVLYTSNSNANHMVASVHIHPVNPLKEPAALRLLLEETRPELMKDFEAGQHTPEVEAAKQVCQIVGYLPLALVYLGPLLKRTNPGEGENITLVRLLEVLTERGFLALKEKEIEKLFATLQLIWERIHDLDAQNLFKLACFWPVATAAPLWLLGLAAGLGEGDIFEPLGRACAALQSVNMLEKSGEQVQIHPLAREFGQKLIKRDGEKGRALLEQAANRLVEICADLNWLEQRAQKYGYRECLEQVRTLRSYVELLGMAVQAEKIRRIERWLDRESYLLADQTWWPELLPDIFCQQLINRSREAGEAGDLLKTDRTPTRWVRQMNQVGVQDQALLRIFAGHKGQVNSVAFSPDGQWVLSGSADGTVRLWNASNGMELYRYSHSSPATSIALSPDKLWVLSGFEDGTGLLWQPHSGRSFSFKHSSPVRNVAFSSDGSQAFTGLADGTVLKWEVSTRKGKRFWKHDSQVSSVAFFQDGQRVLNGFVDGTVRLWELSGGKEERFTGHSEQVNCVAFSSNEQWVLSGSKDTTLRLWETGTGQNACFKGHSAQVNSVGFSPDRKWVLSGSDDRTVRLWDTSNEKELACFQGHSGRVSSVAFSPDGQHILSGSADKTVRLWEVSSGKEAYFQGDNSPVNSITFTPGGQQILSGSRDGIVRLWDLHSGKELRRFQGHKDSISSVAFSPDGDRVLSGSADGTVRLWDASTGKELRRFEHDGWVNSVTFSPGGQRVLSSSDDGTVRLWDTSNGNELRRFQVENRKINRIAFSPDGKKILGSSGDGMIWVWERESGKVLAHSREHSDQESSIAFSPDGHMVLSSADSETGGDSESSPDIKMLRLWKAENGKELARFQGYSGEISNIMFSPDGRLAITCDIHGWVYFWRTQPPGVGHLLGIYVAANEIGAIHWRDATHMIMVDKRWSQGRPNFYELSLEGM